MVALSKVPFALPAHVANEVALQREPLVRFRRDGEATHVSTNGNRFNIFDEGAWSLRYRGEPDRYTLTDRAVETTGCSNDHTNVVGRTPTLKAAKARAEAILAEEAARGLDPHRTVVERPTPRATYWDALSRLRDGGLIDYDEFHRRLAAWDQKHCAKFNVSEGRRDLQPMTPGDLAQIRDVLLTDEERRELQLAGISEQGAKVARVGRTDGACPYASGTAAERAWKAGYWRALATGT